MPPISPYGLIQESLWPDRWLILVACMMLNCTRRSQVERIWPTFISRCGTPKALLALDRAELVEIVRSLGLGARRAENLLAMTEAYVRSGWMHPMELPGIGQYAARAWDIFVLGELGDEPPKDHALVQYWRWALNNRTNAQ